jgi:hypothetical protein
MKKYLLPILVGFAATNPAYAEVKSQTDLGFVSGHTAEVSAKPADIWKRLLAPKDWWSPAHSWSGKVDGFYIDAQAGGCFCELIQEKGADGKTVQRGSVEHMRVIFVDKEKVLRMQGALGPLQSEAVLGTFTVAMEALKDGTGTKLSFNYSVGGYTRFPMAKMATAIDAVIAEQFASLIKPLGKSSVEEVKVDSWTLDPEKLESRDLVEEKPLDKPEMEEKPVVKKPEVKPKTDSSKPKIGKPEKVEPDIVEDGR